MEALPLLAHKARSSTKSCRQISPASGGRLIRMNAWRWRFSISTTPSSIGPRLFGDGRNCLPPGTAWLRTRCRGRRQVTELGTRREEFLSRVHERYGLQESATHMAKRLTRSWSR